MADPPPTDFDSISLPPFEHFYNPGSDQIPISELMSDLGFPVDGDGDIELTFDGIDDLYFPDENETFLIPLNQEHCGDFTPESEGSGISGDAVRESPKDSDDRSLDLPTPVSSHGSLNYVSDTSSPSPESGNVVDQKVKVEEAVAATTTATTAITKRKKEEVEEDMSDESRNIKYRRRSGEEGSAITGEEGEEEEDEKKKKARLMRNRESAQLSRQRKKHYVEELEEKVKNMHSTITDLNGKISYFIAENATLRQQLGGGGGPVHHHHHPPPPPPMGMYPPMPYPWMPCPPYMMKQHGSQVPLIPIPRLKPKNPLGSSKSNSKKTKKVASISFLGLLLCLLLFGALAPIVNVSYGGISGGGFYGNYRSSYVTDYIYNNQHRDRVLDTSRSDVNCGGRDSDRGVVKNSSGNGSEPLVASLFVPRNDKLVKIDGNLIINSILASEKAVKAKDFSPAVPLPDVGMTEDLAKHLYRSKGEKRKALASGGDDTLKDQFKTKAANGEMQQWFREGVAGPMFSSGMCTEVFQFDVSSTSGAIIPAATNVSTEHSKNTTDTNKRKNRRILRGVPIPLPGTDFNLTKEHQRNSSSNSKEIEKPASSMVVSVLVDPREGGDGGDIDGIIGGPKSLSRVFVVVLVDSSKYVTYSCVLPRSPHLVTT